MTARDYIPMDAPFVDAPLFRPTVPADENRGFNDPRRVLLSSKGSSILGHTQGGAESQIMGTPRYPSITHSKLFPTTTNPYMPSSQGLSRYLSAPSAHLNPSGIWFTHQEAAMTERPRTTTGVESAPFGSSGALSTGALKRRVLGPDGQRLPSVVKKSLPLPPEDIRSVPHMRSASRPSSPVVTVGMIDGDGVPVPWTKTPELVPIIAASSRDLVRESTGPVSLADEVREKMRQDFDSIEAFIDQVFAS